MTLSEVHDRPELLAKYLGIPFAETALTERSGPYGYATTTRTIPAEEVAARAWGAYRAALDDDWRRAAANPWKEQTWGQFVSECLREALGIKSRGKLADRLDYARMARPDLYGAPDGKSLRERSATAAA